MPKKKRHCEHPYEEWDPYEGDFVEKPCPYPYFGPGEDLWTSKEIDCCIFHASMEAKKDHEEQFWDKFENLFARAEEAAETEEEKKNVWLECYGFVFPYTGGRFHYRKFPFSVNMWHAQFSGRADFRIAQFSGEARFWSAQFSGDASFWGAQFSGYADFSFAKFSGTVRFQGAEFLSDASIWGAQFTGAVAFWRTQFSGTAGFRNAEFSDDAYFSTAKFSGDADFRGAEITQGDFVGLDIKGFDFSGAKIGEFAQTAEYDEKKTEDAGDCKFRKIKTLKPVGSVDFTEVKYNAHNLYLKRVWDEAFYGALWLFTRPVKWLLKVTQGRDLTISKFPSRIYRRTKFYYVDTSAVDWSGNRQLERNIKYQQFLHQIWERGFVSKVFYSFWWVTSRCGESIWRWISVSVALVLLFACIYYYVPQMGYRTLITERDEATIFRDGTETALTVRNLQPEQPSFKTSLYFSVVTFTTLGFGDVTQTGDYGKLVVGIEVVLGYIMLGGLIAIFGNKFIRRE